MLEQCGGMKGGSIVGWNFTSKLIPSEKGPTWRPECDDLTVQVYLYDPDIIVELVFHTVCYSHFVSLAVFNGVFDVPEKGALLWAAARSSSRDDLEKATYVYAFEIEWRIL